MSYKYNIMENPTNVIYCGDNLRIMREMPDESVDLIYLDPPFFSNRHYEVIWGDDQETQSFGDRWEGGIEHYIGWMNERLVEMHRILKSSGSIYLHCDHHASHRLKIEMDKIFKNNLKAEIIWKRKHQSRGTQLGHNHDTIFYYTKSSKNYIFNTQTVIKIVDKPTYRDGKPVKTAPGSGYSAEKQKEMLSNGGAYLTKNGKIRQVTYLKKDKNGNVIDEVPIDNIWTDIPNMMHTPKAERLGYPTQKPLKLLDRIIKMSSNPNDIVFDPFCGCGTALAVAKKIGRKWIGIDVSPTACPVVADRLGISHSLIIGMPVDPKDFRKMEPAHFQQWVCTRMSARNTSPDPEKTPPDGGVDGIVKSTVFTDKESVGAPIQVKRNTTSGVGVNTIRNFFAVMHDLKKTKGYVVAISFGKGAVEQVAKYKNEGSVEIILVKAEDIAEKGYFEK